MSPISLLGLAGCLLAVMSVVSGQGYNKDGYFQYVNVPGHKQYEFGYKRGNPYHNTARYEQTKGHRFRTRAVWKDKDGYGEHYWEYNHGPKKGYSSGSSGSGSGIGYGKHPKELPPISGPAYGKP